MSYIDRSNAFTLKDRTIYVQAGHKTYLECVNTDSNPQ